MKKLLKYVLFLGILSAISIGTNVLADGEIITHSIQQNNIQSTFVEVSGEVNAQESGFIRKVGFTNFFTFDNIPSGNNLGICNYLQSTVVQAANGYRVGDTFYTTKISLIPSTQYYYAACGQDSSENVIYGELKDFFTTPTTTYEITTNNAIRIDYNKYRLGVASNTTVGLEKFGFKITNDANDLRNITGNIPPGPSDLNISGCSTSSNSINNNLHSFTKDFDNLELGKTYYYQGCALDSSGKLHKGYVYNFTIAEEGSTEIDIANAVDCEIDYIEFVEYNRSMPNSVPGKPQFESFVDFQGKDLSLVIHTKNSNKCAGVNINFVKLGTQSKGNIYDNNEVILYFDDGGVFDTNGKYSLRLIAGDNSGACDYIIDGQENICRVMVKTEYGRRTVSDSQPKYFWSEGPKSTTASDYLSLQEEVSEQHANKGTLVYRKKSGDKVWKEWRSDDPTYEEIIKASPTGPCVDPKDPTEYLEGCYEFLAPIPGIELDADGNVNNKDFIVDGNRIAIKNIRDYELGDYINKIFQIAIAILGVLSVIMIIIAGVQYMAVESIYGKTDARNKIVGAVSGLILALGIFLILNTINPELLEVNFADKIKTVSVNVREGSIMLDSNPITIGGDTRNVDPNWAKENAPKLKFGSVDVKACDTDNMETYSAFGYQVTTRKELKNKVLLVHDKWMAMGNDKYKINSVGGYSCRTITENGRDLSTHSYGITLDINSTTNQYIPNKPTAGWGPRATYTNMPPSFVNLFINEGFGWGGDWKSKKDAMHYSKAGGKELGDQKF